MDDFRFDAGFQYIEMHGPFHAIQVIVEAGAGIDEEGGRYAVQMQFFGQRKREMILDLLDRVLCLPDIQFRMVGFNGGNQS